MLNILAKWKNELNSKAIAHTSPFDPLHYYLALKGLGGGGVEGSGLDLLALLAFFPSVVSFFFYPK